MIIRTKIGFLKWRFPGHVEPEEGQIRRVMTLLAVTVHPNGVHQGTTAATNDHLIVPK